MIFIFILAGISVVASFIGLFSVPRRLFLLYRNTNIGVIPYTEVQEEVITLWFGLILTLFSIQIEFYYLAFGVGLYIVGNLLKHVWDLINYKKHKKEQIIDYYYSKPKVKEYLEKSEYKTDNIRFLYNQKLGLRKIMITEVEENDVSTLINSLINDDIINDFQKVNVGTEKRKLWIYITLQVLFNGLITWYLLATLQDVLFN